jgi:integrase/recombinase XerD
LRIDRVDQKDGRDYDAAMPDELVIYLDHYINRILPRLLKGRTSDRLWISTRGTGMSASTVYYQICRVTRRLIGHSINPHAFRDCVMTTIASDAPEQVQAGARLLGHRNLRTSERHYNFATSLAAQRQYHEVLRSLRERTAMSNTRGK